MSFEFAFALAIATIVGRASIILIQQLYNTVIFFRRRWPVQLLGYKRLMKAKLFIFSHRGTFLVAGLIFAFVFGFSFFDTPAFRGFFLALSVPAIGMIDYLMFILAGGNRRELCSITKSRFSSSSNVVLVGTALFVSVSALGLAKGKENLSRWVSVETRATLHKRFEYFHASLIAVTGSGVLVRYTNIRSETCGEAVNITYEMFAFIPNEEIVAIKTQPAFWESQRPQFVLDCDS